MLLSDRVLGCYDTGRKTRLYVDDGPEGVGATLAQAYKVEGQDRQGWRPVHYSSHAKTSAELRYGKVEEPMERLQLSPRERKRRQGVAKKRIKEHWVLTE